jgi:hypothetical protein
MGYDSEIRARRRMCPEAAMKTRAFLIALLLCATPALGQAPPAPQARQTPPQFAPAQPAAAAPAAPAKIDPVKEASIRRLLELSGSAARARQSVDQVMGQLRPALARSLPAGERGKTIADAFLEKVGTRLKPETLIDTMVPIYDRYFSAEDIKGLAEFFASPLGQRMVGVMQQVQEESFAAGNALGEKVIRDTLHELAQTYPELKELESPSPDQK